MGETVKVLDRNGVLQLCSALKTKNDSLYVSKSGGASNQITAMTGYSKPSSASAIAATDSLNQAIGKLEYKVDNASGGGGSSSKIDSGITKVSDIIQFSWWNDGSGSWGSMGLVASDSSNNKDCVSLWKDGNKVHFEIYGGVKVTVPANTTIQSGMEISVNNGNMPSGFRPSSDIIRPGYFMNRYNEYREAIPVNVEVRSNGWIFMYFPKFEAFSNSSSSSDEYIFVLDANYPLQ